MTTISDARNLGNGVEEVRFDASPIEEDVPCDWASDGFEEAESSPEPQTLSQIHETIVGDTEPTAHDVQLAAPVKTPLAQETDVLRHDMDDLKPIEVKEQRRRRYERRREQCRSQSRR